MSFGLHQLFEYFVAVALVVLSVHIGRGDLLLGAGAALGFLAVTGRGPLGLARICGSRLHALCDVVAGILLAASPLIGALRPSVVGIVAVEVVAVAWLRLAMLTRYTVTTAPAETVPVAGIPGTPPPFTDGEQATNGERASGPSSPGTALAVVRGAGRLAAGARRRLPEAKAALDAGARQAGTHAGRLQRAWRRAGR